MSRVKPQGFPGDNQLEQLGLKTFFQPLVPRMVRKRPGKDSLSFSSAPGSCPGKPAGAPGSEGTV